MVVHIIVEGTVYFMYKEIFCRNNFTYCSLSGRMAFSSAYIGGAATDLNADVILIGNHQQFFFQVFKCIVDGRYR